MQVETSSPRPSNAIDAEAFLRDIQALRRELQASLGEDDLAHLRKFESWGRAATAIGALTCWMGPNPVSAAALALGRSTRWILMHHIGHRGYDRVPGVEPRYTSSVFAEGKRRMLDWADWMTPEAWKFEHNVLHHANTGEEGDPDLIERNTEWIHSLPKPARWAIFAILTATWRESYYAPATMEALMTSKNGRKPTTAELYREVTKQCYLPYAAVDLALFPALFLPLGPFAALSALANSVLADFLSNAHTFLVVGPNHTADDLYRFDGPSRSTAEHVVRQVVSSCNYAIGSDHGRYGDLVDYAHLFLNYQIEHHLFPDVPMLAYKRIAPKVRAICEKHGVPYVQESVFQRFGKMARVFVGEAKMRRDADAVFGFG
jgi:fatty acid desaturase